LLFLAAHGSNPDFYAGIGDAVAGCCMTANAGTSVIEERETFDKLASGDEAISSLQLSGVKLLITDIDTDNPKLYFINSNALRYHWKCFNENPGWDLSLLDFNMRTYTYFNTARMVKPGYFRI